MKIKHLIIILISLCLISIFINRKTLFPLKEGVKCKEKCPAAEYGMSQPDANYCWSNGGRNKWCSPSNEAGNIVTDYRKWACNNCSECKQYAGGPWKKYLKPPVRCAPDRWTPKWASWDWSKKWCRDYHKTLERQKKHLRYGASGCKKYSPKWGEHKTNKPCIKYYWYGGCKKRGWYTKALCKIRY